MGYLPLARKYRPQAFADLIGQSHVTTTLTRALESQRVTQAYLFAGMRGVGKTSAARILAKCLNCEQGPTASPCDRCTSCVSIIQGNCLDVIEIDGASNRGIDEIRTLRESVPFAPTTGAFRVYIIDEVHMLTPEAFNALLKTLEEPPAHVKFIFATTAANKVPATILSRCQRFDFHRLEVPTLVGALKRVASAEKMRISEPALYAIARAADGSLRDAEVILEQVSSFVEGAIEESDVTALLGAVESESLMALTQAIIERQAPRALELAIQQFDQGKDPQQLLAVLLSHLRNLLIIRSTQDSPSRNALLARLVDEPPERMAQLEEQAGRLSTEEWLLFLQLLTGAYEMIRRSPMGRTILELILIKLCTRETWRSLDEISRRLEELSQGGGSPSGAPPAGSRSAPSSAAPAFPPQSARPSAPAPTPAAAPSVAPSPAPEELAAIWPTFLERLGAQKISLAAYLAESQPLSLEGGTLKVGVPGFALHQEVLSATENRKLIVGLLSELCRASAVEYETLPESARPAPTAAAPPVVQDIVKLFNATLLDRPQTTS